MRRLVLVAVCALTLGGASGASTAKFPALGGRPGSEEVRLIAVGDFGVGLPAERSIGDAIRRFGVINPSQVFVALGDNDYTRSVGGFRRSWQTGFGWLRRQNIGVVGVLGNHDVKLQGGRYEFATLGMPRRFYSRRIGDVELFALDTNAIDGAQQRWLEQALTDSDARWKIAVFHHPAYTCGTYHDSRAIIRSWVPLFESFGVQLVLAGHDHNYQRFAQRDGVTYVVEGGGGARLYRLRRCDATPPRQVVGRSTHGFLYLVVRPDRLDGYALTLGGRVIDRFSVAP